MIPPGGEVPEECEADQVHRAAVGAHRHHADDPNPEAQTGEIVCPSSVGRLVYKRLGARHTRLTRHSRHSLGDYEAASKFLASYTNLREALDARHSARHSVIQLFQYSVIRVVSMARAMAETLPLPRPLPATLNSPCPMQAGYYD